MNNNTKWRSIGDTEETDKIKMKNNTKFERIGNTEETYPIIIPNKLLFTMGILKILHLRLKQGREKSRE